MNNKIIRTRTIIIITMMIIEIIGLGAVQAFSELLKIADRHH